MALNVGCMAERNILITSFNIDTSMKILQKVSHHSGGLGATEVEWVYISNICAIIYSLAGFGFWAQI